MAVADVSGKSLTELLSLAGRVAVVTGGARGLGAQTVRRLAEAGANVVAGDLDDVATVALATEVTATGGGRVIGARMDVADTDTIRAVADLAVSEFGRLDIWVNNAGIFPATGPAIDVSDDFVDRMLTVNARGTFAGSREAAKRMSDGGVIINISSTAGFVA
ncbi:MAG TPA: SDR family NAD(P)-dependent oxidoreductase, partial [Ilumatobacteraceae bacterium]|nr:SDR family NAD(P)-dependent oxidoreductase [Ilumatobacteraceae bacterium]